MPASIATASTRPYIVHVYDNNGNFKRLSVPLVNYPKLQWSINGGSHPFELDFSTNDKTAQAPAQGDLIVLTEQGGDGTTITRGICHNPVVEIAGDQLSCKVQVAPLAAELGETPFNNNYTVATDTGQIMRDAVNTTKHFTATAAEIPNTGITAIIDMSNYTALKALEDAKRLTGPYCWWRADDTVQKVYAGTANPAGVTADYTVKLSQEVTAETSEAPFDALLNFIPIQGGVPSGQTRPIVSVYDAGFILHANAIGNPIPSPVHAPSSTYGVKALTSPLVYSNVTNQTTLDNMASTVGQQFNRLTKSYHLEITGYGQRIVAGKVLRVWEPDHWVNPQAYQGAGTYSPNLVVMDVEVEGPVQHVVAADMPVSIQDFQVILDRMAGSTATTASTAVQPGQPGVISPGMVGAGNPAIPTGLAIATGIDNIAQTNNAYLTASWTANAGSDNVVAYEVRWHKQGDASYTYERTTNTAFKIKNVVPGTTYLIAVQAINNLGGASGFTAEASQAAATDTVAPATPTGLAAVKSPRGALVSWNGNTEADLQGYQVQVSVAGGAYALVTPGASLATSIAYTAPSGTAQGTSLAFQVRAVDWSGNYSAWSAAASTTSDTVATVDFSPALQSFLANPNPMNALKNPGAEQGLIFWGVNNNAALALDTTASDAHTGTQCFDVQYVSGQAGSVFATNENGGTVQFPVNPGDVIYFGGWVYVVATGGQGAGISLEVVDKNLVPTAYATTGAITTTGVWTYLSGTYTAGANDKYFHFYLGANNAAGAAHARYDDLVLAIQVPGGSGIVAQSITATQIAANTITAGQLAAGAVTTDKLTVGSVGDTVVLNGGFEDLDGSGYPASWGAYGGGNYSTAPDTGTSFAGSRSMKLHVGTAGAGNTAGIVQVNAASIPVSAGDWWYGSVQAKASAVGLGSFYFRFNWGTTVGNNDLGASDLVSVASPSTTGFQKYEAVVQAPAGAKYLTVTLFSYQPTVAGDIWVDDVQVRRAVGTANILDASIVTAKIANLAVTDAQIANMTVDKLAAGNLKVFGTITTGGLQTAASGARVVMDSAGLRIYDGTATNYGAPSGAGVRVELKNDGTGFFSGAIAAAGVKASYFFATTADTNVPTLPTPPVTNGVGSVMLDPANGLRFWSGNGTVATLIAQWQTNGTLTIYSGASIYAATIATEQTIGTGTDTTTGFKLSGSNVDVFGDSAATAGVRIWSYGDGPWVQIGYLGTKHASNGSIFTSRTMLTDAGTGNGVVIPAWLTDGWSNALYAAGTTLSTVTNNANVNQNPLDLTLSAYNGAGSGAGVGNIITTGPIKVPATAGGSVAATNYGSLPVKLAETVLAASAASVTLSSIPRSFRTLEGRLWRQRDSSAGTAMNNCVMRPNGDTTAGHYYQEYVEQLDTTVSGFSNLGNQNWFYVCYVANGGAGGNRGGQATWRISDYASASSDFHLDWQNGLVITGGAGLNRNRFGSGLLLGSSAAITSVVYLTDSGNNLAVGSGFSLWGIP